MNKADILTRLRDSKKAHMTWVMYAHALIEGLEVEKEKVPVHGTECVFGRWYYGDGQLLSLLPAFRRIEEPHLKLHDVYLEIYKLLRITEKRDDAGLFGRILGSQKKLEEEKAAAVAQARRHFTELKLLSKQITQYLDELQEQLVAMSEAQFNQLLATQGVTVAGRGAVETGSPVPGRPR